MDSLGKILKLCDMGYNCADLRYCAVETRSQTLKI